MIITYFLILNFIIKFTGLHLNKFTAFRPLIIQIIQNQLNHQVLLTFLIFFTTLFWEFFHLSFINFQLKNYLFSDQQTKMKFIVLVKWKVVAEERDFLVRRVFFVLKFLLTFFMALRFFRLFWSLLIIFFRPWVRIFHLFFQVFSLITQRFDFV